MQTSTLLLYIRRVTAAGGSDLPDRELLRRFVANRDEQAFAALVRRHAALVYGVCRRVLGREQDAEDAFQATFLVLAKKAASVCWRDSAGAWLYEVAQRLSHKARAASARRRGRPGRADAPQAATSAATEASWREAQAILDDELRRMPDRYRAPVLLCCLEGATRDEAARQLGWSLRVLKRRLEQGRALLRQRLARRGIPLTAALAGVAVARGAASAAPGPALVRAAIVFAGRRAMLTDVPANVLALAKGAMPTMFWTKLRWAAASLALVGLVGAAAVAWAAAAPAPAPQEPAAGASPREAAAPAPGRVRELEEALRACADIKEPGRKARALLVVAEAQTAAGDNAAALRTIREAFELAGTIPEDRLENVEARCRLFDLVVQGQARAGDFAAAQKSAEAIRPPKEEIKGAERPVGVSRGSAYEQLATALAGAGKLGEADRIAGHIGKEFWYMGSKVRLAVMNARARAGDWKGARETIGRMDKEGRFQGLADLARRQAGAGRKGEAGKTIAEGLEAARDLADEETRDVALSKLAAAQADVGDLPGALRTAESCPGKQLRTVQGELVTFPFKERCLAELRTRSGDFKGARAAADAIDDAYQEGYQKGHALRVIARAQAEAKDLKGALVTAAAIKHDFLRPATYIDIGRARAQAGDRPGAAAAFARALELAREIPEGASWFLGSDDARSTLLRTLAAAQEEAGEGAAARAWIAKLESPYLKVWALAGLSEGAVKSAEGKQRPGGE